MSNTKLTKSDKADMLTNVLERAYNTANIVSMVLGKTDLGWQNDALLEHIVELFEQHIGPLQGVEDRKAWAAQMLAEFKKYGEQPAVKTVLNDRGKFELVVLVNTSDDKGAAKLTYFKIGEVLLK